MEQYSVLRSFKAIERADVALLMIDATTGITSQDAHIAGFILDQWKSCVVIVNKWDQVKIRVPMVMRRTRVEPAVAVSPAV